MGTISAALKGKEIQLDLLKTILFLIILSINILIGCNKNDYNSNNFQILDSNNVVEIEDISKKIISQDSLISIVRFNNKEISLDTLIKDEKFKTEYAKLPTTFTITIGKNYNIKIPIAGSEIQFWKKDFGDININFDSNNLEQILKEFKINVDKFKEIVLFLSKYQLYSITKFIDKNYIRIYTKINEGYLYTPISDEVPIWVEPKVIRKINSNIYYFRFY